MGIHPARILRQRSIPPPTVLSQRKVVQEGENVDTSGWKVGTWARDNCLYGRKDGSWWKDKDSGTSGDVPHTYDVVTVMIYVMLCLLLILFGLFMSCFTLVTGTTSNSFTATIIP